MQIHTRQITILAVGRPGAIWDPALADYEMRLLRPVTFEAHQLKATPLGDGNEAARDADSARVIERLDRLAAGSGPAPSVLVADPRGKRLSSDEFAHWVAEQAHVVGVIGGAPGLNDSVRQRANLTLSFGKATFPHGMARAMLTEQLYRAMKILRGEPYHH